jgi:[acyl-carrier-protein] S-malonyltransferase
MRRYAVLCPGQGAQHAGMFSWLQEDPAAQEVLQSARDVLECGLGTLAGDPKRSHTNRNAQPLIVAAAVAAWRALKSTLPEPAFFAGYSVGELSAYGCAGSLELHELFSLVRQRAVLMSECAPAESGLMAVWGANYSGVIRLCAATEAHMAIINGPDRHVIGGTRAALTRFAAEAQSLNWKLTLLPIDVPAHTPLLQGAKLAYAEVLKVSSLKGPERPVLAGTSAQAVTTRAEAIDTLAMQLATPIDWHRCITTLTERGCRVFLELPPGRALTQMLREQYREAEARAVEDFRSLDAVRTWLHQRSWQ